jgi:hypothetical protein
MFLTDPQEEYRLLTFSRDLAVLAQNMRMYSNITSICGAML